MKFFAIAGPIRPEFNYYVPFELRLDEEELHRFIDEGNYFVLHAPRQTGKTSTMLHYAAQLNAQGKYNALYVNIEAAQAARNDYITGLTSILGEFLERIIDQLPQELYVIDYITEILQAKQIIGTSLASTLTKWALHTQKPIVLFIDEIDCLVGDTLISVLRQLRSGYDKRPRAFPQSVCLIGVRDVRDYRIWSSADQQMVFGGSAFNIKARSFRLADFTKEQVRDLYLQHTTETGQRFEEEAIDYAFELTQGQPWLVNALAYQICSALVTDRTQTITKTDFECAKENLIANRDTHLDVLIDRLEEPRVRNIIDAIISGSEGLHNFPTDDVQYVIDLGLVARRDGKLVIANPLYQEVLPRELTNQVQGKISQKQMWYLDKRGLFDMHKMLAGFTQFYRENSAMWLEQFSYKEAGPHLLLMAFLQRIVNGGGKIHREYALGRGRVDILVLWKTQRIVIELKLYRSNKTVEEGLQQTVRYMDSVNATEGHLIVFDTVSDKSWDEKIYTKEEAVGNHTITVWGL